MIKREKLQNKLRDLGYRYHTETRTTRKCGACQAHSAAYFFQRKQSSQKRQFVHCYAVLAVTVMKLTTSYTRQERNIRTTKTLHDAAGLGYKRLVYDRDKLKEHLEQTGITG